MISIYPEEVDPYFVDHVRGFIKESVRIAYIDWSNEIEPPLLYPYLYFNADVIVVDCEVNDVFWILRKFCFENTEITVNDLRDVPLGEGYVERLKELDLYFNYKAVVVENNNGRIVYIISESYEPKKYLFPFHVGYENVIFSRYFCCIDEKHDKLETSLSFTELYLDAYDKGNYNYPSIVDENP